MQYSPLHAQVEMHLVDYLLPDGYTLRESWSARQIGMGKIDVPATDDPAAILNNPAGLGIISTENRYGAAGFSYNPVLPILKSPQLWKQQGYATFSPSPAIGNFGFNFVMTSSGTYEQCNDLHLLDSMEYYNNYSRDEEWLDYCDTVICSDTGDRCSCGYRVSDCRSYEEFRQYDLLLALSYGRRFSTGTFLQHAIGITAKYFHRKYYLNSYYRMPIAFDIGYLLNSTVGIGYGLSISNIGPLMRWESHGQYYDERSDSTVTETWSGTVASPFIITTGLQYDLRKLLEKIDWLNIMLAASVRGVFMAWDESYDALPFYKAPRAEHKTESPAEYSFGTEITLFNRFFLRFGMHIDTFDKRYSTTLHGNPESTDINYGIGVRIADHINCNWYYDNQKIDGEKLPYWGCSLDITNVFNWKTM